MVAADLAGDQDMRQKEWKFRHRCGKHYCVRVMDRCICVAESMCLCHRPGTTSSWSSLLLACVLPPPDELIKYLRGSESERIWKRITSAPSRVLVRLASDRYRQIYKSEPTAWFLGPVPERAVAGPDWRLAPPPPDLIENRCEHFKDKPRTQ